MATIELSNIAHCYPGCGDSYALKPLSVSWEDGKRYAILGPSGCGKTTMLNIMSGLITPSQGRVLFDGLDVTEQATSQRNIAQVFQFPVIYGTMTVGDNLAFPLKCRNVSPERIKTKVGEVSELLGLERLLEKTANKLTADQKQLISLGRGLVRDDVAAILMDEPLTVIDPDLKWRLRRKLKQVNEEYKLTLIYVTHDQNEAMTFADEVAVMNEGNLVQKDEAVELFENPTDEFVSYFIGTPPMNLIDCEAVDEFSVRMGSVNIAVKCSLNVHDRALRLGIRPEFVQIGVSINQENAVNVSVKRIEDLGNFKIVTCNCYGTDLRIKMPRNTNVEMNDLVVRFPIDKVRIFSSGILLDSSS